MFGNNMQRLSTRLLNKFGNNLVYKNVETRGDYDPQTGDNVHTTKQYNIKGTFTGYATSDVVAGVANIDDLRLTIPIQDFLPTKDDEVLLGGKWWNVMQIGKITTQDLDVLYELQMRSK